MDSDDFINSLYYFIFEYSDRIPEDYLEKNGIRDVSELPIIISNAIEGKKENGLSKLTNVRNYLRESLDYYRKVYGYDNGFESQEEVEFILRDLITNLEPTNFTKMAQLISPEEIINIKKVMRKKHMPEDIEREITSFVGKKPTGGYRKKGTKVLRKRKTRKLKKPKKRIKTNKK
jgi:hypothetical protein